jgi:hypothetical protein
VPDVIVIGRGLAGIAFFDIKGGLVSNVQVDADLGESFVARSGIFLGGVVVNHGSIVVVLHLAR